MELARLGEVMRMAVDGRIPQIVRVYEGTRGRELVYRSTLGRPSVDELSEIARTVNQCGMKVRFECAR